MREDKLLDCFSHKICRTLIALAAFNFFESSEDGFDFPLPCFDPPLSPLVAFAFGGIVN
jgi:hypothetical protein